MTDSPSTPASWADTTDQWAARRHHNVVLPSGQKAVVQRAELGMLALANAIPEDHLELAQEELTHPAGATGAYGEQVAGILKADPPDDDAQAKFRELTSSFSQMMKWLVAEHVLVEPRVTVDDLSSDRFPLQDLNWLYGFALRRVDEDALGRRVGVARLDEFATFPEKHGCAPDCEGCMRALQAHSTADLGAL